MNNPTKLTTKLPLALAALCLLFAGCATIPNSPNVMVLPGSGMSFDQFQYDDGLCRQWSEQAIGKTSAEAATDSTIVGATLGTALGAATGAAIGAAAGNPGMGAAVGAGVGLLGGTASGAEYGAYADYQIQQRYDAAYIQCMYAKGHQVPMPRGSQPTRVSSSRHAIPPPPPGRPPAPPVPVY